MIVHSLAADGSPDDSTFLLLPRLAAALNTSAAVNGSGVGDLVCSGEECAALASFSMCLWVNLLLRMSASVVVSYFISSYTHNALQIRLVEQQIIIGYMKDSRTTAGTVSPLAWHLLCMVRRGQTTTLTLDHHHVLDISSPMPLLLNGSLVLGNDQDKLDSGYTTTEAFLGEIAWLGLWDAALTSGDLAALLRCRPVRRPTITAAHPPWLVRGHITTREGDPCQERDAPRSLSVLALVPYSDAREFCRQRGMSLPLPDSSTASRRLARAQKAFTSDRCVSPYADLWFLWLAAEYRPERGRWVDGRSGKDMPYVPTTLTSPLDTFSHAVIDSRGLWISTMEKEVHCFLCEGVLGGGAHLLRGLCRTPLYFWPRANSSGSMYWHGETGVSLVLRDGLWQLRDMGGLVAAQTKSPGLPFGRCMWQVLNVSLCVAPVTQPTVATPLSLSECREGFFSCWAGGCVPMDKRCSLTPECPDSSDERGCQLVHLRPGASQHLPPQSLDFTLDASLRLRKVSVARTRTGPGVLRASVWGRLRWRDNRLTFHNLQWAQDLNAVDLTQPVWRPALQVLEEARLAGSVPPLTRLLVSRDAEGTDTGFDMVFKGRENRMVLLVEIAAHVSCPFSFGRYPFDVQSCGVTLHLANLPEQHARFSPHAITHACPRKTMVEFVLEDCTLHLQNGSNVVRLNMTLRRRWSYHLWATYVPTALLHLVGFGTLTVRTEDFQSRGMLSLLALLALVGLYSDTLAALPSCSYLRLLDAWLLFSVAFLAAVIAVHVAASDPHRSTSRRILRLGKGVLAALYCGFVASYCVLIAATR